jgi:hypothetical protein
VKLLPVENMSCTTALRRSPRPFAPFGELGSWEIAPYEWSRRLPTRVLGIE